MRHLSRDQELPAGTHTRSWDGRDDSGRGLASGIYVIRLATGNEVIRHKMTLVR